MFNDLVLADGLRRGSRDLVARRLPEVQVPNRDRHCPRSSIMCVYM